MGNELEELKRILDDDEEVIDSYKPNKKRFVHLNLLLTGFIFLLFTGGLLTFGILGLTGVITFLNDNGEKEIFPAIMVTVVASIPLLFYLITIIGTIIKYRRAFYVVTNKRIIIRTGIIGVDYKSLDIKNVISVDVRVDFLDKLVHPNTGSIVFGNAAAPVYASPNRRYPAAYSFAHIDNPYEVYKKLKEHIN